MNDEQKYTIQGLEEYIRQGEPQQRERGKAWKVAIGLQQVDGLKTSEYLLDTARKHIEGAITIEEAKELIDSYNKSADGRKLVENDRTEEADKVSARITEILAEKTFSFTPAQLTSIHRRLFDGIYKLAGRIRDYNITKNEWVLGGKPMRTDRSGAEEKQVPAVHNFILSGPFLGVQGRVLRVRKDRKVALQLAGVVAVAVSDIPVSDLKIIENLQGL